MSPVRLALIAAAACLVGSAAYARSASDQTNPPPADSSPAPAQPAPTDNNMAAPPPAPPTDVGTTPAPTGTPVNASANVDAVTGAQVIASQPVPDTPANRAAFGKPMSHAGKRTAPAGN